MSSNIDNNNIDKVIIYIYKNIKDLESAEEKLFDYYNDNIEQLSDNEIETNIEKKNEENVKENLKIIALELYKNFKKYKTLNVNLTKFKRIYFIINNIIEYLNNYNVESINLHSFDNNMLNVENFDKKKLIDEITEKQKLIKGYIDNTEELISKLTNIWNPTYDMINKYIKEIRVEDIFNEPNKINILNNCIKENNEYKRRVLIDIAKQKIICSIDKFIY